jgi:phenylpyruvate tautomerase PptA (4-oxalocrotonate tautomerase family)
LVIHGEKSEENAMPMMELTYPAGALTPEARAEVVEKLTDALLRHEGATVNRMTHGLSWVFVHEAPEGHVNVGGKPVVRPVYRLMVTVPQGTLLQGPGPVGQTSRRGLFREATEIILNGEGTEYNDQEALRVYILVREIEDGYWGGGGQMVRMEDIVAMAEPTAPRTAVADQIVAVADALLEQQLGPEKVPAEA